jgi:hypothetical protein
VRNQGFRKNGPCVGKLPVIELNLFISSDIRSPSSYRVVRRVHLTSAFRGVRRGVLMKNML